MHREERQSRRPLPSIFDQVRAPHGPSKDVETSMSYAGIVSNISATPVGSRGPGLKTGESVASIQVESGRDQVTLKYRSRSYGEEWSNVHQTVPLEWTRCRFGGERPWFVCSVCSNGHYCGRNVTRLYSAGKLFACRKCHGLAYASQRGIPESTRPLPRTKDFVSAWAEASACSKSFRTSPRECIGGLTIGCADATIWLRHDPWLD